MSGRPSYKHTLSDQIRRRSFLIRMGLITGSIFLNGCYKKIKGSRYSIPGKLLGPDAVAGHLLRDKIPLPEPSRTSMTRILIIGSGIAGLSAGRWLKKHGETDFRIVELERHTGGNAHSGKNKISAYPLAAHYITIPNNDDRLLLDFLEETGVITHYENDLPCYNDYYLTFDPEERLLINGQWQEGLIPDFGVPETDKAQIRQFLDEAERLRYTRGRDGKFVFDIPVINSSKDPAFTRLDEIPFKEYLQQQGYTSEYLLWYLNYACKDDYGQKIDRVSAWAGLHYFASRRGKASNAEDHAVLTWPEGNGWLMQRMAENLQHHITTQHMCSRLELAQDGKVTAHLYDLQTKVSECIRAEKVILCCPQFVTQKLLHKINRPGTDYRAFNYAPWLVANITVSQFPESGGTGLCWDNVAYNTDSVGYVNATHQQPVSYPARSRVITYYLPLCKNEARVERIAAYSRTFEQWLDIVLPELEYMHPGIKKRIENIDLWVWGHGMIYPAKGFTLGTQLAQARQPIDNKIFFAHSDLSGISIFEEAFHQGIRAAKEVLNHA